jgi:hypothetical protein
MRRRGQEMPVVRPDLGFALIRCCGEVDRVAGAQIDFSRQSSHGETDTPQQPLSDGYDSPGPILYMAEKTLEQCICLRRG